MSLEATSAPLIGAPERWSRRATEPQVLFPAIAVLMLSMIWGGTWNLIRVERAAAERAAAVSSRELAETYEAQVVRALREIDQTMKFVKYAYEFRGQEPVLQELKSRALLLPDLLFDISLADRAGAIVASTRPLATINVADQEYFLRQRQARDLVVDLPQREGADEWKLRFSRRLDAADGSFDGVVVVAVDASYFVSNYESSRLGEQGVLGIVGTDGVFRVKRTGEALSAGDEVDYSQLVPTSDEGGGEATLAINAWDGVRRYTSARQLYDFPLAVVVGLSHQEQLAAVRNNRYAYLWRASASSVLLIMILALLGRLSRQLVQSRQRTAEAQAEHAAAVALRTEALGEANANLERSNRDLQDFAFVASHDLKEPLRKVRVFGGRLREEFATILGDRGGDYLERMNGAAERMQRLIDDLLRYAHVTSRGQPFAPIELGEIAQGVLSDLEVSIDSVQATVKIDRLPRVLADPTQMRQLFQNLIGNALKFSSDRKVEISVTTGERMREGKAFWVLEFRDNGIGFEAQDAERIFTPFHRLHGHGKFEGSGIGLAIVRKIVERHGGSIRAQSQPGAGSTFIVELPSLQAGVSAPAARPTSIGNSGTLAPDKPGVADG